MVRRFFIAVMVGLLLAGSAASADVSGPVSLSTQRTDDCQVGDTCENTFNASWDGVPAPVGGTLKVEAYGPNPSKQEFRAKFAMTVSVPPKTKKISLSSVWRLRGGATAANEATAGCSVRHSQVNYIVETAIFYANGTGGVPVIGFGVPVSAEFTFTETLESSKSFPRKMTLWAELLCVAYGQATETAGSSAEVTLSPESGDGLGTALLHLHAAFPR